MQIDERRLLVFGGLDKRTRFNDVWIFHTQELTWQEQKVEGPAPEPRAHFTASKLQVGGRAGSGVQALLHAGISRCRDSTTWL